MKKRFEALDSFRGIFALFVVIFHMQLLGSITQLNFFRGSSIFVEFFFVLSGFVLAHGYGFKKNLDFNTFMKARFFRLYPLHFFMFIVFLVLEFGKFFAYKYGGLVFNYKPFTNSTAVSEIIPNLLLVQSWTPFTNALSFNYPSWSISIEFYMYALLFFSIVLFKSYRVLSWFAVSLIAFFLIYIESDLLVINVLKGLSCFFGGSFVYVIYKQISHLKLSYVSGSFIEAILLMLVVLIVQSENSYRGIIAPVLFIISILFFAFEFGVFSKVLKARPLQYVGKLSYSIYMTHAAILFCLTSTAMVVQKIIGKEVAPVFEGTRFLDFGSSTINNLVVIAILGIVIYISSLTYKHIEIRGQKLNKKSKSKPVVAETLNIKT